jgi:hypothetical protein
MVVGNELRVVVIGFAEASFVVNMKLFHQVREEVLGHVESQSYTPINANIFLHVLQNRYTLDPEEVYLSFDVGHDYHEYLLVFDIF